MSENSATYRAFMTLPRRVFIDSSVLQNMHRYGDVLFDNQELGSNAHIRKWEHGPLEVMSLRNILFVARRGDFQFALSRNNIREVAQKADPLFLDWTREMFWYWEECLAWTGIPDPDHAELTCAKLDRDSFSYLSRGDRALLRDAIMVGCDAFLTLDFRLRKNSSHLEQQLKIRVLSPSDYWNLIRPWAALYV